MTPSQQAAHDYAARGWHVVPIPPGIKHPALRAWQDQATTDGDLIDQWWTTWPDHGVGIATGAKSGIWVLDVDLAPGGDDTLADLEATHGALPATVEVITGTGGRHLYFNLGGHDIRNDQAGRLGPGLDIRGTGGQVLAPPTIHPNGQPYEWEASSHPDDTAVADTPAWLIGILTAAPTGTPTPRAPRPADDDRPGSWLDTVATWPDLLTADGATYLGTRNDHRSGGSYEVWARPGVDHISATLYYRGSDVLKCFTSNWPGLATDETYTRFGYYAATRHRGDHAAAARALRVDGWKGQTPPDTRDDWLADVVEETPTTPPTTTPTPIDAPWPNPEPFTSNPGHGPAFPVDALPAWIADQVDQTADAYQVPADLPATLALGVLATISAGRARTRLNGTRWTEPHNLYLTVALPPGAGKSPVFKAMLSPVNALEAEMRQQMRKTIVEAEVKKELLEARVKNAKTEAGKGGTKTLTDVLSLQAEADLIDVPKPPQLLAEDATPEALTMLLADHGGRGAVVSSEGGIFDMMCGAYAEKGRPVNLDVYLKGWSGDSMRVNRVKRDPIHIPEALLTVCVTIQPWQLGVIAKSAELTGRGLLARFMYSVPPSRVGHRDRYKVLTHVDPDVGDEYHDRIMGLGRRLASYGHPVELHLDDDATHRYIAWDQVLERRCRPGADLADLAEWAAKLRGSAIRLCGLLHLADGERGPEIGADTLERALTIAGYWTEHALLVYSAYETDAAKVSAEAVIDWAIEEGIDEFTARDLYLARRRQYPVIATTVPGLSKACELGWLRPLDGLPINVGSRAPGSSPRFALHPKAAELVRAVRAGEMPSASESGQDDTTGRFEGLSARSARNQAPENVQVSDSARSARVRVCTSFEPPPLVDNFHISPPYPARTRALRALGDEEDPGQERQPGIPPTRRAPDLPDHEPEI